jgi:peptidase E
MSKFFQSEVVRVNLEELEEMQKRLFKEMMYVPFYDKEQKKGHLNLMKEFLEKQKVFIFRLSLSDDPEAVDMKERMLNSAEILGFDKSQGFDAFFKMLEGSIKGLENTLDD